MSIIDELNREFTDILFSSKFFEEDGWNELYSLIKKAKEDGLTKFSEGKSERDKFGITHIFEDLTILIMVTENVLKKLETDDSTALYYLLVKILIFFL